MNEVPVAGVCEVGDGMVIGGDIVAGAYYFVWEGTRPDGTTVVIKDRKWMCRTGEIASNGNACPPF